MTVSRVLLYPPGAAKASTSVDDCRAQSSRQETLIPGCDSHAVVVERRLEDGGTGLRNERDASSCIIVVGVEAPEMDQVGFERQERA